MSNRTARTRWLAILFVAALASKAPAAFPQGPEDVKLSARLEQPITLDLDKVAFGSVLKAIRAKTVKPGGLGVPFFVDPVALDATEMTMATPITIHVKDLPLKEALSQILEPRGLSYTVRGGLVHIGVPPQAPRDQKSVQVLAKLEKTSDFKLEEVTLTEALNEFKAKSGVTAYVDPVGLQESGFTLKSHVTYVSKGKPLGDSLREILKPLGLAYRVRGGMLSVTSEEAIDEPISP